MCKPRSSKGARRGFIRIHPLLLLLLGAAWLGDYLPLYLISWASALLHECAHLWAGHCLGISFAGIQLLPFGVCAKLAQPVIRDPRREILLALAGPVCSALLAGALWVLTRRWPLPLLEYGIAANVAMALLNLLPCLPLDGGRALRACLTLSTDALTAWRVSLKISRWTAIALLAAATGLLLCSPFRFSLILIGVFLLGSLCVQQQSISQEALRELLYHKGKLTEEALNRAVVLAAPESLPARRLLRKLSYHCYYIIQVVDAAERPVKTLTEGQILTALLTRGIRITLRDV